MSLKTPETESANSETKPRVRRQKMVGSSISKLLEQSAGFGRVE
jgi:hypothetical protein